MRLECSYVRFITVNDTQAWVVLYVVFLHSSWIAHDSLRIVSIICYCFYKIILSVPNSSIHVIVVTVYGLLSLREGFYSFT